MSLKKGEFTFDPKERGEYWGGYVDTFRVYSYSPIPKGVSLELIKNIKGVEGGIWTEYIDSDHFDEMIFPKFMALAEVAWTQPSLRNWKDFSTRLGHYHLPRFDYYGLNYRLPSPGYKITSSELFANVAFPGLILRYTLDGLLPTIQSTLFVKPVEIGNKVVTMCTFNVLQRNSCMSL